MSQCTGHYRRCALWRHCDTKTSRFCPALCACIMFCINLSVIAFELCDLWRYSLTTFMQSTMRAHSAGQISMQGGVDVNKGHMVYTNEPCNILILKLIVLFVHLSRVGPRAMHSTSASLPISLSFKTTNPSGGKNGSISSWMRLRTSKTSNHRGK